MEEAVKKRAEIHYRKMTEMPVNKLILSLCVPTVISMLITTIYNAADTYFVSKISVSASGAVGILFSLMAILQAFGFMCGHGSGSWIIHGDDSGAQCICVGFNGIVISSCIGLDGVDPHAVFFRRLVDCVDVDGAF